MAAIIPDHSVAAIMLPLVLTIADKTDIRKRPNEMIALVLAVAFSCSIAGLATPSGGARNVIAMGFLEELYDIPVDYNNSTVLDIEMDGNFIVVLVDVGPLNRLILIDILTGQQEIISNPIWPAESPSIDGNYIAFLQRPVTTSSLNLDISSFKREVFLWDILSDNNNRIQITHDDLTYSHPHVLNNGITWITIDEDGNSELVIYSLEKTFEEYSSVVLQSAILMLIPLLLVCQLP